MLFLISIVLALLFTGLCRKPLKKAPLLFYAAAVLLSAVMVCCDFRTVPRPLYEYGICLFTRGSFATALWCVVMWTGALPNGSKLMKAWMPVRGELSIFAAILTLGHNIGFGRTYFVRLFTDPGGMPAGQAAAGIMTIVMLLIMIPLTVLSFPFVRRKMQPKRWKQIQRTAYLFYALIYLHIMTLFLPFAQAGKSGYFLSILLYSCVFLGYAVCRVRKYLVSRKRVQRSPVLNAVCTAAFALLAGTAALQARPVTVVSAGTDPAVSSAAESFEPVSGETVSAPEDSAPLAEPSAAVPVSTPEESAQISEPDSSEAGSSEPESTDSQSVYADGTYTASAFGYDGDITVTITVEQDRVTAIAAETDESDPWYLEEAEAGVIPQILDTQTPQVDAVAGATYTSEAIMQAVEKALESAKN